MRINTGCFLNGCKCFDPEDEDGVGIKPDKEWVGLTDEEVADVGLFHAVVDAECVRAIEAKLKEKNA